VGSILSAFIQLAFIVAAHAKTLWKQGQHRNVVTLEHRCFLPAGPSVVVFCYQLQHSAENGTWSASTSEQLLQV